MDRAATGADGRAWTLRSQLEWRTPATADDFEHDVAGGYVSAAVMLVVMLIFAVILLVWLPDAVVVPYWVLLILVLIALYFPLRWVLRRPWKIVAETQGGVGSEQPAERWVGTIRGMFAMRDEMSRLRKSIEKNSLPESDGVLRPVE